MCSGDFSFGGFQCHDTTCWSEAAAPSINRQFSTCLPLRSPPLLLTFQPGTKGAEEADLKIVKLFEKLQIPRFHFARPGLGVAAG